MTPDQPPTPDPAAPAGPLIDFAALARRLGRAAAALGSLVVVLALVDGVLNGFSPGRVAGWLAAGVIGIVVTDTVFVAVHALRGADRAQKRGERLASEDVGLLPPGRQPPRR